MKVEIVISHADVMNLVEGISVIISEHNGGTPSYEQLWASPDDAPKLNIYYGEAVHTLERSLLEWLKESNAVLLKEEGNNDYTLSLSLNEHWPRKFLPLLKNKVQDYLVHSVTAGWLSDFEGVKSQQNYSTSTAQDLSDIRLVISRKEFSFAEKERGSDNGSKGDTVFSSSAVERSAADTGKGDTVFSSSAVERSAADTGKGDTVSSSSAVERSAGDTGKGDAESNTVAEERSTGDIGKEESNRESIAGRRRTDSSSREDENTEFAARKRSSEEYKETGSVRTKSRRRTFDNCEKSEQSNGAVEVRREDDDSRAETRRGADEARSFDSSKKSVQSHGAVEARREDDDSRAETRRGADEVRNEDDAVIRRHHDWTDWSGTHFSLEHRRKFHRPFERNGQASAEEVTPEEDNETTISNDN